MDYVEMWCAHLRAGGTPSASIRMRAHYLRRLARAVKLEEATTDDLTRWMGEHEGWAPNTRKTVRSALRAFYRWMSAAGHVEHSPADALPVVTVPRGRAKPTPELAYRGALREPDERLVLMVRLAGQLGLRRGEIARCRRDDLERDFVGWSLRVRGKGGHVRLVPVPDDLARAILDRPAGWLFPSTTTHSHLTPGHVGKLLSDALPIGYSGHSLRHRCGTTAYRATKDVFAVQALLGHVRPETTLGYVALDGDAVRAAVVAAAA